VAVSRSLRELHVRRSRGGQNFRQEAFGLSQRVSRAYGNENFDPRHEWVLDALQVVMEKRRE
jgi:hypothetical protein